MDRKFREEREKALDEIHEAILQRIKDLLPWSRAFMQGKERLTLPDHMRVHESFRWPNALLFSVEDLKAQKPLKEIFARVSGRYQAPDPRQVLGLSQDLDPSPEARRDGRVAAFEDVMKLIDAAERDFDISYKPLSGESLAFWQKRESRAPEDMERAYRENQRQFMKESLQDLRTLVEELKNPRPKPSRTRPPSP